MNPMMVNRSVPAGTTIGRDDDEHENVEKGSFFIGTLGSNGSLPIMYYQQLIFVFNE